MWYLMVRSCLSMWLHTLGRRSIAVLCIKIDLHFESVKISFHIIVGFLIHLMIGLIIILCRGKIIKFFRIYFICFNVVVTIIVVMRCSSHINFIVIRCLYRKVFKCFKLDTNWLLHCMKGGIKWARGREALLLIW